MIQRILERPVLLALLIGVIHTFAIQWAWSYIVIYSPYPTWLIEQGLRGSQYYELRFVIDFFITFILCVPAAFLLCRLRPSRLWLYLLLAIVPGLLWTYRLVLLEPLPSADFFLLLPGLTLSVVPLAVAALVAHSLVNLAPNYSLKRTNQSLRD